MTRYIKDPAKHVGLPPGTLVHVGERKAGRVRIMLISYNDKEFKEREISSIDECRELLEPGRITWIDVRGLHQVEVIEWIGQCFHLHPLILEDILNTDQRPKLEEYDGLLYFIFKQFAFNGRHRLQSEQFSLILSQDFVLTFQESEDDDFAPIREQLRNPQSRARRLHADFLAYLLLDRVVDSYFLILDNLGERIENLEDRILARPGPRVIHDIHQVKSELVVLRRSIWPLREVINLIDTGDTPLIDDATRIYLRDLHDHTIQIMDTIETYRDIIGSAMDIYLSAVSNRMNEVVKILTIITTIFMPLTLIAGIYGMNFTHMPGQEKSWGFWAVILLMVTCVAVMLWLFRRRKWL